MVTDVNNLQSHNRLVHTCSSQQLWRHGNHKIQKLNSWTILLTENIQTMYLPTITGNETFPSCSDRRTTLSKIEHTSLNATKFLSVITRNFRLTLIVTKATTVIFLFLDPRNGQRWAEQTGQTRRYESETTESFGECQCHFTEVLLQTALLFLVSERLNSNCKPHAVLS